VLATVVLSVAALTDAQAQPSYPVLTSPPTGADLLKPTDVVFTWQASTGATKYAVKILTDPTADWSTALRIEVTPTRLAANAELYPLLAGRQIAWRVEACNAQNQCVENTGGARLARIPLFPAPLASPAHQSYTENRRPTFTWKRQTGAQYYKVIVNGQAITSGNGVQGNATAPAGTTYSFTPTQDLQGSVADWSVQSCATIGGGMLCGPAFNSQQVFRLNFGTAPASTGPFVPDLGPGGPAGNFLPGGVAVSSTEYVVEGDTARGVPNFAKPFGYSFQATPLTATAQCGVGSGSTPGFSNAPVYMLQAPGVPSTLPIKYEMSFHLVAATPTAALGKNVVLPKCSFSLFTGKRLRPGWRLMSASLTRNVNHPGTGMWTFFIDRAPNGTDDASFSVQASMASFSVVFSAVMLEIDRLVFRGPAGKTWQDAFRP
jgi:hypothetical protein